MKVPFVSKEKMKEIDNLMIDFFGVKVSKLMELAGYNSALLAKRFIKKKCLVVCGKGISGSMPLSAVLGRCDLIELDPTLTSTHGGHPMSCAAALGNLESIVEYNLVDRAEKMGTKLFTMLEEWRNEFPERIPLILGNGMVWAVFISFPGSNELDADFTDRLVEKAMQKGVYSIRTGCGTIKIGPPLTIEEDALNEAIQVYKESMYELNKTN